MLLVSMQGSTCSLHFLTRLHLLAPLLSNKHHMPICISSRN
ncbi:hypothetical protein LINGRAHAP2_LOCUS4751 [Linum grandiflorum]